MTDYEQLVAFLGIGVVLGAFALLVPTLISPRYKGPESAQTYECGIDTVGSAWIRFDISFYLYALIFVAFEVDILYLFPVALVFNEAAFGWRALVEVCIFLLILSLAIVFAWRKGVIRWSR